MPEEFAASVRLPIFSGLRSYGSGFGSFYQILQLFKSQRFGETTPGPQFPGLLQPFFFGKSCHYHGGRSNAPPRHVTKDGNAILAGHDQIKQDKVEMLAFN